MYVGVDGGGTKTAFVVLNKQGRILARHRELSAYYLETGIDGLQNMLTRGTNELLKQASLKPSEVDFAFFGLPAYGEDSKITEHLNQLPSSIFKPSQYQCDNDMVCGWAGSLACDNGINIVSGTGSIAYGENNQLTARCGGWGELFSDEGSAFWIARKGLTAFSKMSDGRLPKGPLYSLMKEHLSLDIDLDICGLILDQWKGSRSKVSSLSIIVKTAAEMNDPVALLIFSQAANELASIINSTAHKLKLTNETFELSYTGGVFNTKNIILAPLLKKLKQLNLKFNLVTPQFHPVVGASLYAAKLDGFTFDAKAKLILKGEIP